MADIQKRGNAVAERARGKVWFIVGLCTIGVALLVWFGAGSGRHALDSASRGVTEDPGPASPDAASSKIDSEGSTPASVVTAPKAPPADQRIDERGRLSIDAASLPGGGVWTLGLGLPDEARGDEPLPIVIASVDDGRRLELATEAVVGKESGVRVAIDVEWLKPGRYMIQIKTAEKSVFPLRRYVLEVK
jgi:hypothetical protein